MLAGEGIRQNAKPALPTSTHTEALLSSQWACHSKGRQWQKEHRVHPVEEGTFLTEPCSYGHMKGV